MEDQVKIVPITKRAKDRVNQHGEYMTLVSEHPKHGMLFQSLNKTWRGEHWMGWFKVGEEIEVVWK